MDLWQQSRTDFCDGGPGQTKWNAVFWRKDSRLPGVGNCGIRSKFEWIGQQGGRTRKRRPHAWAKGGELGGEKPTLICEQAGRGRDAKMRVMALLMWVGP